MLHMNLFKTKTPEDATTNNDRKVNPAVAWVAGTVTAAAAVVGLGTMVEGGAANADHGPANAPVSAPQTPGAEVSAPPQKIMEGQTLQPKPIVEQSVPVAPHTLAPTPEPIVPHHDTVQHKDAPQEVIINDSGMKPSQSTAPVEITPDDSGMMPSSQPSPSEVLPDDSGMMPSAQPTPQEVTINDSGMLPK